MSEHIKPSQPRAIAFVDVNVLPMDSETVFENQTVLVQEGRISAIGGVDTIEVPAGSMVIEASGAYLMPGLADMHTHPGVFDSDPNHLILYISNGVTTIRSLNSPWDTFQWRSKVNSGELIGPSIFLSGPAIVGVPEDAKLLAFGLRAVLGAIVFLVSAIIFALSWQGVRWFSGPELSDLFMTTLAIPWLIITLILAVILLWLRIIPITRLVEIIIPQAAVVETASQARAAVKRQVKAGADFIKPYDFLTRETYYATLSAAQGNRMYTAGHIPDKPDVIRIEDALAAEQDEIVHMDEFTHEFWPDYDPKVNGKLDWKIDMSPIVKVVDAVAEYDAAVTATLVTNEVVLLGLEDIDTLLTKPEYKLI